jgi:uncharacterized membrane protein YfcA
MPAQSYHSRPYHEPMMTLSPAQWVVALVGAFIVGLSKTSISGLGILFVALFALVLPSTKQATGIVLPLLIFGDFVAVVVFRQHTQWRFLWKLLPATAVGVVLGFIALGRISDPGARLLVGCIICSLALLSVALRRRRAAADGGPADGGAAPLSRFFAPAIGIIAGFITLIANAAGPVMAIYFVTMRMPKMQYMGTVAVFFMLLNLFKVPFMVRLGLITPQSFEFNLVLLPAVLLGTLAGRWLLAHINQRVFENIVLAVSAIAGLLMIF